MKVTAAKTLPSIARWYNIRTVPKTQWRNSTRESIWNRFESVSVTAIGISLALLLSGRIAKELRIALYLDCELVSQLKLFRVFYFNRHWYVFPFSFPSGSRSNIQCMHCWVTRNVKKRVISSWYTKNCKRFVEVTIQVKSHLNQDNHKLTEG